MMKNLNKLIGIGFTVLATGVAGAVGLSDCTKDGATITIPGVDESFPKYEGWIPWLKPYSNGHDWGTDQKAVIWTNKKLSDVKAMRCKMSGAWFGGAERDGRALITKRTDSTMEVQFQCQDGSACKTVLAHLEQSGDDIVIWGQQAGYSETVKIGSPIPDFWLQVSSTPNNGAYGVYGIEVLNVLETTPTELKEYAATVGESGTDTLQVNEGTLAIKPTQTNDVFDLTITGNANVYFEKGDDIEVEVLGGQNLTENERIVLSEYSIDDIEVVSAKSGGFWMGIADFGIYHLKYTDNSITFQAQKDDGNNTQAILVELKNSSSGVSARFVWGRYANHNTRKVGEDFSVGEYGEIGSYYYSLSSLVLKVKPSILYSAAKSGGTTWGTTVGGVTVCVTKQPLPAYSLTTISNGGLLKLAVSSGGDYNKDSDNRRYVVEKDSHLILAEQMSVAEGGSVVLDGGCLRMLNGFLYVNLLSITNGGSIVGSTTCRAGYGRDVTWNIYGPDPVTIEPGIELTAGWRTVTVKSEVPTTIVGSLKDAGGYAGATFAKDGAATLTLGSENYNVGPFKVVAGELIFANPKGIKSNNAVILGGGGYVGPRAG